MEKDGGIRAISRGIAVLRAVNRHGSLTMMEIANEVDLAYPTACRIIETLVEYGMIEREVGRKRYRPTALVQTLSLGYQQEDRLALTSRPHITEITKRLSWPVSICSRVGMNMVIRESTHSLTPFTLNVYYSGYSMPLLASSSGMAYLAFCPAEERRAIFDGIRRYQGDGASNVAAIERTLDEIRERGFSLQDRLQHTANPGRTSSISAPIFDGDCLTGTLTLIYYASAMMIDRAAKQFGEPVCACARRISEDLSEHPPGLPEPTAAGRSEPQVPFRARVPTRAAASPSMA